MGNARRVALAVGLLAGGQVCSATEILLQGSLIGVMDGNEGSDAGDAYETAEDQVLLTVCNTGSIDVVWRVDVRRDDQSWPEGLKLFIRRTGEGSGPGRVIGRRSWVEVGTTLTALCRGKGDRMNIPLQFRLTGLPLELCAGTHVAGIVYTVVEIGR